ncbi:MAG: citrate (Si)-synthase [Acidobacteria bacterium RIFCSPLOWO2_02_FULL_61_28]|nr:MAG: citrate (Si)-synthase [Acidobacteria bacterium RIFCSPLOWO2_02_FULL_61_28]
MSATNTIPATATETATITIGGKTVSLPIITGTENEKAIDIARLRQETACVTLDHGYMNTGSCVSSVAFIDGDQGILRYRGYPIEQLAKSSTFTETAYLLIYGKLPTRGELDRFNTLLTRHSMIHEDMKRFFDGYPSTAHPMAILSAMVCSLSSYYPQALEPNRRDHLDLMIGRLLAKMPTIVALSYKKSIGQPFAYPLNSLDYPSNFLHMLFSVPAEEYHVDPDVARALDLLLILHADHEQNCSTSTVRLVGSSQANLFASIAAGICALWGPLHGGANQEVMAMLQTIHEDGGNVDKYIAMSKDKKSDFRLMGFGHRVYKNFDPRAKIIKEACDAVLAKLGVNDPLLDIARRLEERALKDDYFVSHKLYPNVDFYSGIIYKAIGIPTNMFTVMFAMGRLPGWIAQWKEMTESPNTKIGRPRQIYVGATARDYTPIEKRG